MGRWGINVPKVTPRTRVALVSRLGRFERLVEVGIGRQTDVAAALASGRSMTATDIVDRAVPSDVRFCLDDVTDPDPAVYASADAVYALNLPPELHRPTLHVARQAGAAFAFTTLGGEFPEVEARPEALPGETLFWAREPAGSGEPPNPEGP